SLRRLRRAGDRLRTGDRSPDRERLRGVPGEHRCGRAAGTVCRSAALQPALLRDRLPDHRGVLDDGKGCRGGPGRAGAVLRAALPDLYAEQRGWVAGGDGQRRPALLSLALWGAAVGTGGRGPGTIGRAALALLVDRRGDAQ